MTDINTQAAVFLPVLTALTPLLLKVESQVVYNEQDGYGLKLGGFYKDNSVTVYATGRRGMDHSYLVKGRYENLLFLYEGEDDLLQKIIQLNADRFRYWNRVKPEFDTIDARWLPLLQEAGLVEVTTKTTYTIR
jgi:hypothetical protein